MSVVGISLVLLCAGATPSADAATSDTGQVRAPQPDSGLPWHLPEVRVATPTPPRKKEHRVVTLQLRPLLPPSDSFAPGAAVLGQLEQQYIKAFGGVVYLNEAGGFVGGFGVGGNSGIRVVEKDRFGFAILGPELELGLSLILTDGSGDFGQGVGLWFDTSLAGLRLEYCPVKVDVRPRVTLMMGSEMQPVPALGLSLDIGVAR